jgi:rubrerythrin
MSSNEALSKGQVNELVYQALETELGGVQVYRMALKCVLNDDLREEWEEYLDQTEEHVEKLQGICSAMGLDPEHDTPGRQVVRHIGKSLVKAMQLALGGGTPEAAELVAAECVTLAETKDHMNWELLGMVAKNLTGEAQQALTEAYETIEEEEDEHLYHTTGWARELWIQSLGMEAVIPPPEEKQKVKTAIGAAQAKQSRVR